MAYTHRNYIAKGMMPQLSTGNVASFWQNWEKAIAVNDGKRNFSLKTKDCHDQQAPFNENQETITEITHEDHDISQLQDGFWTLTLKLSGRLTGIASTFNDSNHLVKLFVGFKSSNQAFDRGQLLLNGKGIGYNQNEMTREGFAYSNLKGFSERKTRKFIHSLYENVSNYSSSVCGTYLDVDDLKDGATHDFTMKLNIPFTDLLALQAFREFPSSIVGQLAFKGYFSHQGMVYTFVNPATVKDYKEIIQGEETGVDTIGSDTSSHYDHKFIQVGVSSNGIINCTTETSSDITKMTTETGTVCFDITSLQVTELKSNMAGYSVQAGTKQAIVNVFSKGVIIPAQQLDYATFPIPPSALGIIIQLITYLFVILVVYQLCSHDMIKIIQYLRIHVIIIYN